jgi:hypothetical protein
VAVAETTAGSSGNILTVTDDVSGSTDLRSVTFDLIEGTNHIRFYCPKAEVTARKNITNATGTLREYGMTVTAYPDNSNVSVRREFLLDALA